MKNKIKTAGAMIWIVALLLICCLQIPSKSYSATDGYITYEITDGEATITGYEGEIVGELVIPDTLDGCPVTAIGFYAFSFSHELTSVIIPDTIKTIDSTAFFECEKLNYGVYKNGKYMGNEQNPYYALIEVINRDSVTSFSVHADTKIICDYAISNCQELTNVTLPEGLVAIGDGAFHGCRNLSALSIPDTVIIIGESAFSWCSKIDSIILPDGIVTIEADTFTNCENLKSINIPDGVTSIGESAFSECASLSSVVLSDSLLTIGDSAFSGCVSLSSVVLPDRLLTIGDSAFACCDKLIEVAIPSNVSSIGKYAFSYCDDLNGIWVSANNSYYSSDNCGVLFDRNKTRLISAPKALSGAYKIPDGVEIIEQCAFDLCENLKNLFIPKSVNTIKCTFFSCDNLIYNTYDNGMYLGNEENPFHVLVNATDNTIKTCIIHENTVIVAEDAFSFCSDLMEIEIPDGVVMIGDYAFSGCHSLSNLTIPNSVRAIGYGAIDGCNRLTYNTYDNAYYLGNKNNPFQVLVKTISKDIASCDIHKDTGVILEHTFEDCHELVSVNFPENVTTITYGMFQCCWSLTEIEIPDSVTKIDDWAFSCTTMDSITIPPKVEIIGDYAFLGCSLRTITIPKSVKSIGKAVFSQADITDIYYCGTEMQWEEIEKNENAFYDINIHFDVGLLDKTGDVDGINGVNEDDAIYLLQAVLMPDLFSLNQDADFNSDGVLNEDDAIYLLQHVLMPGLFPLE